MTARRVNYPMSSASYSDTGAAWIAAPRAASSEGEGRRLDGGGVDGCGRGEQLLEPLGNLGMCEEPPARMTCQKCH